MNKKNGFTFVEVLAAISILAVGAGGSLALISQVSRVSQISSSRLAASYLAQEGIEIARNIRDGNFLKIRNGVPGVLWIDGLSGCQAEVGCEADYNSGLQTFGDRYLKIDDGFYNYDSGQDSIFKRKIIINQPDQNYLSVEASVTWREKGAEHVFSAESRLYNWLSQ